jgi:hypothetical protein
MPLQILKINSPATITVTPKGSSAVDDYITVDRTSGSSTFSNQIVLSNLFTDAAGKISLNINDIINKKIQTVTLPSLKDSTAIEYIENLGANTLSANGKYRIVEPGDYSKETDGYLAIYATSSNDKSIAQSSTTAVTNIWGGLGDDDLTGAGGGSSIYGGPGNNTLRGRGSEYDYFRAFTADKSTDTIIESSKTGNQNVQIFLPSATIKSWSFKQVKDDLVGTVTDENNSSYNFTIKDQYLNKAINSINVYSGGVAGPNANAYLSGGDLTDEFSGLNTNALIAGTSENDIFNLTNTTRKGSRVFGNEGNDSVITKKDSSLAFWAGQGIDTVTYPDTSSNYKITIDSSTEKNVLFTGATASDRLISVERIIFRDKSVAYDVGQEEASGQTAMILNAAFSKSSLSNKSFVGIGLSLFDNNKSMSEVASLAVGTGLVSPKDNTSFVKSIWQNVVGSPIDSVNLKTYVDMLNNGTYTQPSLLALAATTDLNKATLDLIGLAKTGIEFTPAS